MGGLLNFIFLSLAVGVAANYKTRPGFALFQKKTEHWRLDDSILNELEEITQKTITKLSQYNVSVPSEIILHPMQNVEKNVFNEPFFIGDSSKVFAYHYVSESLSNWCSGIVSRSTGTNVEYENRQIHVIFDCDRVTVVPSLKSIIGMFLVSCFTSTVILCVFHGLDNMRQLEYRDTDTPILIDSDCWVKQDEPMTTQELMEFWDHSNSELER